MQFPLFDEQKVMVIIRHNTSFHVNDVCKSIFDAGFSVTEITMNTPNACELITTAVNYSGSQMAIGAGTVLTLKDARQAIDAGAKFIVSPIFEKEIVEYCARKHIPSFPGVATPTEAYHAFKAGAYMVKLFPASEFSPTYIKSLKAPLPNLKIMAVGGIRPANVNEYFENGADAVAIGSGIINPQWIDEHNFTAIKEILKAFKDGIKQ